MGQFTVKSVVHECAETNATDTTKPMTTMSSSYRTSVTGTSESTTEKAGEVVSSGRMRTMFINSVTPEIAPTAQTPVVNYTAWFTSSTAGEFPSSLKFQGLPKGYFISAF